MNAKQSIDDFFRILERSISETYSTYNETDPGAKLLIESINEHANYIPIENFDLTPQLSKFNSDISGKTEFLRFLEPTINELNESVLDCRFIFETSTHAVAIDALINAHTQIVQCFPNFCTILHGEKAQYDDHYLDLPQDTVDELITFAKSLSLLGRIRNS